MAQTTAREVTHESRFPDMRSPATLATWMPRIGTLLAMATGFVVLTILADDVLLLDLQRVFIFAIAAVSINLLIGYAGQISLGHQAFFGVGALTSAGLVTSVGWSFWPAVIVAALFGATTATLLGAVALRLRGLYLALITLAFGFFAENVLFNIRALTRGAAGMPAPRPEGFGAQLPYLYLCIGFFVAVELLDWRLVSSKAGRAIRAVRDDERVASSVGVNVTLYKVVAFALSGSFAGLAGALFAHQTGLVLASDFNFELALTFVFIAVVGGLGSRVGVFTAAAFFTLFESFAQSLREYVPLIGAILLVLTLILNPGGLAQALRPLVDWLQGKPFRLPQRH